MPSVEARKWFLVAHLLSLSIFDCSKVPKCCFLTKIITFSRHSFEQWAWQVLHLTQIYGEVCCARQKMTFIYLLVFIANIGGLKNSEFFFIYKTKRLNLHSFEKWVCPVFRFAYFNRDTQCGRQKMAFIDSSTFIANI